MELEGKITALDAKIAKLTESSADNSNTNTSETTELVNTQVSSGSNNNTPGQSRSLSPPLHWSTLEVLNQFF